MRRVGQLHVPEIGDCLRQAGLEFNRRTPTQNRFGAGDVRLALQWIVPRQFRKNHGRLRPGHPDPQFGQLAGRKPEVPLPDFEDAYQTQRVLEAALVSARERRSVKLSTIR